MQTFCEHEKPDVRIREIGFKQDCKAIDNSLVLRKRNKTDNKSQSVLQYLLESLILAQDERWRRA